MKYRVIENSGKNWKFSKFFRTKKEAIAFQGEHGGTLQRKIGGEWFNC